MADLKPAIIATYQSAICTVLSEGLDRSESVRDMAETLTNMPGVRESYSLQSEQDLAFFQNGLAFMLALNQVFAKIIGDTYPPAKYEYGAVNG